MSYTYVDQEGTHTVTRQDILDRFWVYWSEKMKALGRADQATEDKCVEDFLVIHWAWPTEPSPVPGQENPG